MLESSVILSVGVRTNQWLPFRRTAPDARIRLFCLPYAGGGASVFRSWSLPGVEICPIQFPGRENRLREPPLTRMTQVVSALAEVLQSLADLPIAFFGHSLGALVAGELAVITDTQHLLVGACPAPHLARRPNPIHQLPEPEFRRALGKWNGIPAAIASEPEVMALYSTVLRADFALYETYLPKANRRLPFPVTAFAGDDDLSIDVADIEAWGEIAPAFSMQTIPGDHFFLRSSKDLLLDAIGRRLGVSPAA